MIKNLAQKNEGTTSFWSYFDHLKAVSPRVNWSMTCLVKVYKVSEQKNEMIKNLGQKNEGITSFLSNFDHLKAVPPKVINFWVQDCKLVHPLHSNYRDPNFLPCILPVHKI